jgi:hypothetical protein
VTYYSENKNDAGDNTEFLNNGPDTKILKNQFFANFNKFSPYQSGSEGGEIILQNAHTICGDFDRKRKGPSASLGYELFTVLNKANMLFEHENSQLLEL